MGVIHTPFISESLTAICIAVELIAMCNNNSLTPRPILAGALTENILRNTVPLRIFTTPESNSTQATAMILEEVKPPVSQETAFMIRNTLRLFSTSFAP